MEVNSVLINNDFINSDYTSNIMNHLPSISNIKQQNNDVTKYGYDRLYNFRGEGAVMIPNYGRMLYEEGNPNSGYKPNGENAGLCQEGIQMPMQHQMGMGPNVNYAYNGSKNLAMGNGVHSNQNDGYALDVDNDMLQKGNMMQKSRVLNSNYLIYSMTAEADVNGSARRVNGGLDLSDNCNANVPEMGGDVINSNNNVLCNRGNFSGNDNNGNNGNNSSNSLMGSDVKMRNSMMLNNGNVNASNNEGYNSMINGNLVTAMIDSDMTMGNNDLQNGHLIHLNGNVYHEMALQEAERTPKNDNVMLDYNDVLYMDHDEENDCHVHSESKSLSMPSCIHTRVRPEFHEIGDKAIELIVGPAKHQVKEFNILPLNVLRISYNAKNSDYIIVKLICDKQIRRHDPTCIFLAGVSAKYSVSETGESILPNMKISKDMLQGRTKGFKFYLNYTLIMDGIEAMTIRSEPFQIWSNVNQLGFPRKQRERHIQERKDTNRKKRKISS